MKIKVAPPSRRNSIVLDRGLTDLLKMLAAIFVAMGHYSSHALDYVDNLLLQFFLMNGGTVGVAVFFFLSGYGLMMSEHKKHLGFLGFLKRRLMNVYLPVIIVSAVWGIVRWPAGAGMEHLPQYMMTTFVTFGDGILWFVRVIAVMYLLFYGYTLVRKHNGLRLPILFVGTAFAYVLVYWWQENWCAISIPIFTLGIVIVEYNEKICRMMHSRGVVIWLMFITALMGLLYLAFGNLYAHALINYWTITAVVMMCAYWTITISLPTWVGGISYDIYLTHNKVINFLRPVYGFIPFHHFIVGTVITAVASYAIRKTIIK